MAKRQLLAPDISPQTDPALAQPEAIPQMPTQVPVPDPGTPPDADMGLQPLPEAAMPAPAPPQSDLASVPAGQPIPEERMGDAQAIAGEPSKERHTAKLHEFDARKTANGLMSASLDVNDPDYAKKLLMAEAQHGQILRDEARYKEAHPWGSMESAHPGVFGKIGHAFGTIGNVLGNATLGAQNMAGIPGSQAAIQQQEAQGTGEIEQAGKGLEQQAAIGKDEAAASEAPSKIKLNEAQAEAAENKEPPIQAPDAQVLAAGQRIAQGIGTPADLALIKSFHDLQQAKQEVKPVKPDTPEQQFLDDYQRQHPGSSIGEAVRAYAQASQKPEKPGAGDARLDRSYQYNQGRLDKIRKPIDDFVARFSRLQDTMNQHSPQADALVAPELLTVMAGGQGSGLRMNEAEIARIVGGRSAWENLKAKMQHWAVNPADARSITADQDRQIRSLVEAVGKKLREKQSILEKTQEELLSANDVDQHRIIMANAQKALDQIDAGAGGGGGHKIKVGGKIYQYKGSGDTADMKNYAEVPSGR